MSFSAGAGAATAAAPAPTAPPTLPASPPTAVCIITRYAPPSSQRSRSASKAALHIRSDRLVDFRIDSISLLVSMPLLLYQIFFNHKLQSLSLILIMAIK